MRKLFLLALSFTLLTTQCVVAQVIDSHSVKSENDWEEDGDATPTMDDIILKVTPNPAGQNAEVIFKNLPGDGTATMKLVDLTGKVYQQVTVGNQSDRSGVIRLATERLTTGLYIVHLTTAWGNIAKRVLIK